MCFTSYMWAVGMCVTPYDLLDSESVLTSNDNGNLFNNISDM